jgi:hypothetical protein
LKQKLECVFRPLPAACAVAAVLAASAASAAQMEQGVYYRAEYTDNVNQTAFETEDELTNVFGYNIIYRDKSGNSRIFVDGELEALIHSMGTQDNRLFGTLDMSYRYSQLPKRLEWVIEDYMRSDQIDQLGGGNADNRQVRNSFRVGPDFNQRLSARDEINTSARLINEYEDRTEYDSNRFMLESAYKHLLGPGTSIGLAYSGLIVDFVDDEKNSDFSQHDLLARYRGRMPRGTYGADVGSSYVDRAGGESSSGLVLGADVAWDINSASTASIEYDQEYSDRSRDTLGPSTATNAVAQGTDVFYDRRLDAGYTYKSSFSTLGVHAHVREKDFENPVVDDEESSGFTADLETEVRPVTDLLVGLGYVKTRFSISGREDELLNVGVGVIRKITRQIDATVRVQHNQLTSTEATEEYEENRISFRLDYRM